MAKSVLILGGGVAGLAAARELIRAHLSVTVLEAQDRLGGRIRTARVGNFPVELGAEFVHGESQPLLHAIHEAGLPTQAVADQNRLLQDGRLEDINLWDRTGDLFKRINPQEADVPFAEFLARQTDIDDRLRRSLWHFVEGFNAADARRISAQALLRAELAAEQMEGSTQLRVTPGYSALIDFLAAEIERGGGSSLKNAHVRQVAWTNRHVEVAVGRHGQIETHTANAAIVTLPVGILKSNAVTFLPPIPKQLEAASKLEFGNVVRITFQFRESFWDDFGFIHTLNEPIPTWWNDPRGPLLVGWAGGPQADGLLKLAQPQLEATGREILGRIFPARREWLRRELVASHYWNWAADPYSRGAYSYIPVHGLHLPQQLAAPVAQTLFFAGEATVSDAQMGTVFGAFESGLRAAREVLDSD